MKTVFFGPFIGEFAWELIHWQGWVRKITREKYSKSRIIVSSYNGRAGLYPHADEFWPLPQWFTDRKINSVRYILKGWKQGLPGSKEIRVVSEKKMKDGRLEISSGPRKFMYPLIMMIRNRWLKNFWQNSKVDFPTRPFCTYLGAITLLRSKNWSLGFYRQTTL